jgi:hypothetical protein
VPVELRGVQHSLERAWPAAACASAITTHVHGHDDLGLQHGVSLLLLSPQVIFGMLGGMLAGAVLGATRLFDNRYKRLIGIYGSGVSEARRPADSCTVCVCVRMRVRVRMRVCACACARGVGSGTTTTTIQRDTHTHTWCGPCAHPRGLLQPQHCSSCSSSSSTTCCLAAPSAR